MEEYFEPQENTELKFNRKKLYNPLKLSSVKTKIKLHSKNLRRKSIQNSEKIKQGSINSTDSRNSFSSVNQFYNIGEDSML